MSDTVSVVIPAHNAADSLGVQVRAVLSQLAEDDQLLIVDNRSTDGTAALAASLAAEDPRVIAVAASRLPGAAHARNVGAARATGAGLLFCDADDVVAPGWADALRAGLAVHDLVAGWQEVEALNPRSVVSIKGRPERAMPSFMGLVTFGHGANMAVRRQLWSALNGMDEDPAVIPGEDVELAIRATACGARLGFCGDAVVHYRYRTDSRSLYRQAVAYQRVMPLLVRRCEEAGLGRGPYFVDPMKWLWLVARLPWARHPEGRMRWAYQAGVKVGLVRGSIAHRRLLL